MMNELPQHHVGKPGNLISGLVGYISRLKGKKSRVSPHTREEEYFERQTQEQFLQLKKKGLSIPIFTL